MRLAIFCIAIAFASPANAQSVTSRVTGAVGGATAAVGGAANSAASGATDFSVLNSTPGSAPMGGDWNGGAKTRIGGKDVTIRGAVASEGSSSAFKAGAGFGF
ncbi:MAG: hypothetical protein HY242_04065 [Afipia sp.]|nr:hypothetical protein [Afipia sp.]